MVVCVAWPMDAHDSKTNELMSLQHFHMVYFIFYLSFFFAKKIVLKKKLNTF